MSEIVKVHAKGLVREEQRELFNVLMKDILNRHLQPQDMNEVAALLESMGWNDQRTSKEFGMNNVFELAEVLWNAIQDKIVYSPFSNVDKPAVLSTVLELLRAFLRGVIFALPMAISVLSMLTLKFSLWSNENLSVELATSIAIGTILSFMTVGGFTQAIARRGFFYIIQGHYHLARRTTYLFIRIGFIVSLALSAIILITDIFFTLFPYRMLFYIVAYFILLSSIWLTVTVMYILRREITFTVFIILGIAIVYVFYKILGMDIIWAQLLAILIISLLSAILIKYYFELDERKSKKTGISHLPRFSITVYTTMHYFFYGFLYFTFLFIDRIVAWSTNNVYMPYVIWFRGEYEIGLDFALLMLVLPMGFCEVSVSWLMKDLEAGQKVYKGSQTSKMNNNYLLMYFRTQGLHVLNAVISGFIIYGVAYYLDHQYYLANGKSFLSSEITQFVLVWALVAYTVLSVFLMNAVILFALSQPYKIINALVPGLIVNFIIGFLLSRWVGYHYAVSGLLAGSVVTAVLSTLNITKVLKKLDYYLYSAS
ncbi:MULTISPECIES: hypothetical protein [unclassified Paenibacillus]|uniref:hypothetical protein n=1 Tax=unclassified Paenibacillus TaxID=185978 RepID=UPI001AE7A888|nr:MULTISPECIES: hypothetical protein [unclassified Paenibacillus]MBP1154242.1 hypothetical protein [Paenibacillus sp. PvP091]MBP1170373.1 hypothetical protein [Paenibacillus sp. PvR098]MBP2441401.1 hypothetical protein [Paenibacillus sp. PvP052]